MSAQENGKYITERALTRTQWENTVADVAIQAYNPAGVWGAVEFVEAGGGLYRLTCEVKTLLDSIEVVSWRHA